MRRARTTTFLALGASIAIATATAGATGTTSVAAAGHVETIVSFDAGAGELPEGVTVDKRGNVFVALSPLGQVVKVPAGTDDVEPFAQVSINPGDFGVLGMTTDAPGNVYAAVLSTDPDSNGVWKFDRKSGDGTRIPGTDVITFPNSVAFDQRGTLYVTDTILGAVWRVPRGGSAEPWIVDPLLAGTGLFDFGFPIGANGISVRHHTVYVGVTEQGSIVTIPIEPDGSAGAASVWFQQIGLAVDGIALDVHGNVYFANPIPSGVYRITTDGVLEALTTDTSVLDNPTSVAFGTGGGDKQTLYAVNFSVALGTPLGAGPSLVAIDAGQPGLPVP